MEAAQGPLIPCRPCRLIHSAAGSNAEGRPQKGAEGTKDEWICASCAFWRLFSLSWIAASTIPGSRMWPRTDMECAGRAQRRRRFGSSAPTGRLSQSGVAPRLPPHSIAAEFLLFMEGERPPRYGIARNEFESHRLSWYHATCPSTNPALLPPEWFRCGRS